jgi:hypothetical protein
MSADPNKTIINPVEQAHLLYVRGDLAEARDLLQMHISAHPSDQEAWKLLHQVERDQVEEVIVKGRKNGWLRNLQLTGPQLACLALFGIFLIVVGIGVSIHPFILGLQDGFYTEMPISGVFWAGRGYSTHYTPSQVLFYPTFWTIGGIIALSVAYRYYQFNRNSNGV